jgi:predicted MFS family arabinose efflux permease
MTLIPQLLRRPLRWPMTFAALNHPNFRLWFIGQMISLVGTWMQTTAQGYLVYELTKSPVFLGYVGFAGGIPAWFFTLYGGVIADRVSRRNLIIITQSSMMILAFILAGLVFTGLVQPWHIIALAFLLGIANAFDAPARQAFVVELVGREDLANAIALNSTLFNGGALIGPAAAGLVYAWVGSAWCFTINGLTFLGVIIALALMHFERPKNAFGRLSAASQIREGLGYLKSHRMVQALMLNMVMICLFGLSLVTLLPAWAVDILGGDVKTNGALLSARGGGALIGALMIAALSRYNIKGKIWTVGSFVMPATILVFAVARWLPFSLVAIAIFGWSFMVQANTSNALIQAEVPDELRGRVMSLYTLTFMGGMPLGSLFAGAAADWFGEPITIQVSAIILLLFAAAIWWRVPKMRRVT